MRPNLFSRNLVLLSTLLFFLLSHLSASDFSKKWGEIDPAHKALTSVSDDSLAEAVILFDYGEIELSLEGRGVQELFSRHYQIKVLTDAGKDYADLVIRYYHKDRVTNLEAQIHAPNGKKSKLKKKNFHEEEYSDVQKVYKGSLPGVAVGSIIEVKYTIRSNYYNQLDPWIFQSELPTLESLVKIKLDRGFAYNVQIRNDFLGKIKETSETYMAGRDGRRTDFIYYADNLPAVRPEAMISTLHNYRARVDFLIRGYTYPNGRKVSLMKDLVTQCDKLLENDYGDFLDPSGDVKDLVKTLISDTMSKQERAEMCYRYVRDQFEPSTSYSSWSFNNDQDELLKIKKATPSERNLLLISMLRAAGIEAKPMLISTFDNGWLDPSFPFLNQFNRTIAALKFGRRYTFLDASDKYLVYGTLPGNAISGVGYVLEKGSTAMEKIPYEGIRSLESLSGKITLLEDGTIEGTTDLNTAGYATSKRYQQLEDSKSPEVFLDDHFGHVLENFELTTYDSTLQPVAAKKLETSFGFTAQNYAEVIDDEMYFNPLIFLPLRTNPFKAKNRNFPIESPYLSKETEMYTWTLPEGWEIAEIPESVIIRSEMLEYRWVVTESISNPREFTCVRIQEGNKLTIPPNDYQKIKNLYAKVVDTNNSQVVIRKTVN